MCCTQRRLLIDRFQQIMKIYALCYYPRHDQKLLASTHYRKRADNPFWLEDFKTARRQTMAIRLIKKLRMSGVTAGRASEHRADLACTDTLTSMSMLQRHRHQIWRAILAQLCSFILCQEQMTALPRCGLELSPLLSSSSQDIGLNVKKSSKYLARVEMNLGRN